MTGTLLEVRDVDKSFGGVKALSDVSLRVDGTGVTALIGPNGAGKTTLFNVISGFGAPYTGTITFDGRDISKLKPHQVARAGLIRTFQTPVGFRTLTVAENVMVALTGTSFDNPWAALVRWRADRQLLADARARADELLETAGIRRLSDTYMADLSPGDLKLIEIVRQLAVGPRMLLLDEPAAAMAVDQIETLSALIRRIVADGIGVLVIDHNLGFVLDLADEVHVLDAGSIVASGSPAEISTDPTVQAVYLGSEEAADVA